MRRIVVVDGWLHAIRHLTATCPPMRAHWRHMANTIELVRNGKWIGSAVFAQFTAEIDHATQCDAA